MSIQVKTFIHPNQARDNGVISNMTPKEIIKKHNSRSVNFSATFRYELWKAHYKKCAYCGTDLESYSDVIIDHFIPKSKVLDNSVQNLVASCSKCNSIKGNHDLEYFRFCLAISNSVLYGVIQPNAAKKLLDLGIDLPITTKPFYFEQLLRETSQ